MGTVVANDLKTKGIKAIEDALLGQLEASVSVRGQVKYVVMSQQQHQYLRECELEAALAESKMDLAGGRFVKETLLLVAALCLLVSKWLVKVGALLTLRRLKLTKAYQFAVHNKKDCLGSLFCWHQ